MEHYAQQFQYVAQRRTILKAAEKKQESDVDVSRSLGYYSTRNSLPDLASNLSPSEVQTKSRTSFSDNDFEKFPV